MAYVPTTFVDRSVEFPNRRTLTAVSGQADTFDVARAEGTVFAEGTKPDAENLNAEFGKIKTETDAINESLLSVKTYVGSDGKLHFTDSTGADSVLPFSGLTKCGFYSSYSISTDIGVYTSAIVDDSGNIISIQKTNSQSGITLGNVIIASYQSFKPLVDGFKYKKSGTSDWVDAAKNTTVGMAQTSCIFKWS